MMQSIKDTELFKTVDTDFSKPEQKVDFFEKKGFVGPFAIRCTTNLVDLHSEMSQAIKESENKDQETSSPNISNTVMDRRIAHTTSRIVYDLSTESQILDDVADFLGSDLLFWMAETIVREPGHDGHIVKSTGQIWHVDVINGWLNGVHTSIAVTDMTMETGCLLVIPGTHKYDADLPALEKAGECDLTDAESLLNLADRMHPENAPHQIKAIEMKAGQYCFTRGGIWHGVSKNHDSKTRFGLVARFARPDVEIRNFSGDQIPCILVRGEDSHQLNQLTNPSENS